MYNKELKETSKNLFIIHVFLSHKDYFGSTFTFTVLKKKKKENHCWLFLK